MKRPILSNLVSSLFIYERIETTLAKAKQAKPLAERLITLAARGGVSARRLASRWVRQRLVVSRLFSVIGPRASDRPTRGGFVRIVRTGWRKGDGAPLAILELIDRKPRPKRPKKAKPAKAEEAPEAAAASAS